MGQRPLGKGTQALSAGIFGPVQSSTRGAVCEGVPPPLELLSKKPAQPFLVPGAVCEGVAVLAQAASLLLQTEGISGQIGYRGQHRRMRMCLPTARSSVAACFLPVFVSQKTP